MEVLIRQKKRGLSIDKYERRYYSLSYSDKLIQIIATLARAKARLLLRKEITAHLRRHCAAYYGLPSINVKYSVQGACGSTDGPVFCHLTYVGITEQK